MSATKENQRDSGEEERKLEGGVLRQDAAPPAPKSSGLHPAVYIAYVPLRKSSTPLDRAPASLTWTAVCGGGAGSGRNDGLHTHTRGLRY